MRTTTKLTVVMLTGAFAVGVVAAVAGPILSRSLASSSTAAVQGVVPTVFDTAPTDETAEPTATWELGDDSSVRFRIVDADDDDIVSSEAAPVNGSLTMSDGVLSQAEFMVDLGSAPIDTGRADDGLLEALRTAASGNSTAVFVLTSPAAVGSGDGSHTTAVSGMLTVSGKAIPVQTTAQVTLEGGTGTLVASFPLRLADYGVDDPDDSSAFFDVHLTLDDR